MARIDSYPSTTLPASDDLLDIDGQTNNTRTLAAANFPLFLASVYSQSTLAAVPTLLAATGIVVEYFDPAANVGGDTTGAIVKYAFLAGAGSGSAPWINQPADYNGVSNSRHWQLVSVTKPGASVMWNATTNKFHASITVGAANAVSIQIDQTGFNLS